MNTYFITGATGVVGSALVERLLLKSDANLRLLIRADNPSHLEKRLDALWTFWDIGAENEKARKRVKAIAGDAVLPRFGLNAEDYNKLAGECSQIIHSAGIVRMNLPIDAARKSAVNSANTIVDLAKACQNRGTLQKVEFVSTVGVGGKMPGILPETWITQKRTFHNTYEQAKAEAEELIHKEVESGLPVTVHRPSMVVGDSRSGKIIHFQIFYHLCEFLSGRRTLGVVPNVRGTRLDIIPADYVAAAIAWSSNEEKTAGAILHLCSGPDGAIDLMELMQIVRNVFLSQGESLPKARIVPVLSFKAALPVIGLFVESKAKRAMKALPVFFDYLAEEQVFLNRETQATLEAVGIQLPAVDSYLYKVLSNHLSNNKPGWS